VVNTTAKGNRADLECRRMFEALGYECEKARVSRGAFDFVARIARSPEICAHIDEASCTFLDGLDDIWGLVPQWSHLAYVQVKCNSVGDARRKFAAAYKKGRFENAVWLIAVRHDGKGGKPPRWTFEVWQP